VTGRASAIPLTIKHLVPIRWIYISDKKFSDKLLLSQFVWQIFMQ
jgi:hypothetical protein